jgi:hypothetical protein
MNKKGEENTLGFTISLFLTVIVLIVFGGCAYKVVTANECPIGYDLVTDYEENNELSKFCGSLEEQEKVGYRCCQRKTNANEYCRYDLNAKDIIICKDIGSFDEYYKASFTCKDETACGSFNSNLNCAGVYCGLSEGGDNQICIVQKVQGIHKGSCEDEIFLGQQTMGFIDDGVTQCGLRAGPQLFGVSCNNEEIQKNYLLGLGNQCVLEYENELLKRSRFLCGGVI